MTKIQFIITQNYRRKKTGKVYFYNTGSKMDNFENFTVLGKTDHLYSALHGIQTTLKRSGMDHTV